MTIGEHVLAANQPKTVTLPADVRFKPTPFIFADNESHLTHSEGDTHNKEVNSAPITFSFSTVRASGTIGIHHLAEQQDQLGINSITITDQDVNQIANGEILNFWCKSPTGEEICTIRVQRQ
jgi:hypothetical protein